MRQLLIAVYLSDDVNEDELVDQLAEIAAIPGVVLHRLDSVDMFIDPGALGPDE